MPGNGCTSHTTSAGLTSTWRPHGTERESISVLNPSFDASTHIRVTHLTEPVKLDFKDALKIGHVRHPAHLCFEDPHVVVSSLVVGMGLQPGFRKSSDPGRGQQWRPMFEMDLYGRIMTSHQDCAQTAAHSLFFEQE